MSKYTMPELYETLTTGGKFKLQFSCKEEAVSFRNKLATHKYRTERELKILGVIQPQTLSMEFNPESNVAEFFLKAPQERELQTYEILTITRATG